MFHQFREIDRVLAMGFNGTYIIRSQVIFLIRMPVVAVGLHNDHLMSGDIIGNIISTVVIPPVVAITPGDPEIPLGPAVVKIDDRVPFWGIVIIARRQEDPVITDLPQHIAVMSAIKDVYFICLGMAYTTNQDEEYKGAGK
jgi:hypothetical protein